MEHSSTSTMTKQERSHPFAIVCLDVVFYVRCPHTLPPCDLASHVWGHFSFPRGEIRGRAEAVTGQAQPQIEPLRGLHVTSLNGARPS